MFRVCHNTVLFYLRFCHLTKSDDLLEPATSTEACSDACIHQVTSKIHALVLLAYLLLPVCVAIEDEDGIQEVQVVHSATTVQHEGALIHRVVRAALAPPNVSFSGGFADNALVLGGATCKV